MAPGRCQRDEPLGDGIPGPAARPFRPALVHAENRSGPVRARHTAADVRIERIISQGHTSPADSWYDQPQHEWVIVLKGAARLQFEDGMVEMKPGDFINIPAFKKHRVDWTTPGEPTVWLGVRYGDHG